jgi:hypothetical protein
MLIHNPRTSKSLNVSLIVPQLLLNKPTNNNRIIKTIPIIKINANLIGNLSFAITRLPILINYYMIITIIIIIQVHGNA